MGENTKMKTLLRSVLGWKWIENYAARKAACAAATGLLALTAKYKLAGLIAGAFGLSADVETGGLVTLAIAGIEALRVSLNDPK